MVSGHLAEDSSHDFARASFGKARTELQKVDSALKTCRVYLACDSQHMFNQVSLVNYLKNQKYLGQPDPHLNYGHLVKHPPLHLKGYLIKHPPNLNAVSSLTFCKG